MDLDRALLRKLAEWSPAGVPITSIYLTVDGRRYPRKAEYEVRLDEMIRRARGQTSGLDRDAARSVEADLAAISRFVREGFDRGDTRGLAMFSAHGEGLWEEVRVPRPVYDRALVAPQADLLPLEHLLETYQSICTALVDYEKARLFLAELGRMEEASDVCDEVPGRHDQGGRAQMRMQRHVDDHRLHHLRHVADALFRLWQDRAFDHLVLAGSNDVVAHLEPFLHDYLRQRVRARIVLPIVASQEEVLRRSLAIEEGLEREAERGRIAALTQAARTGGRGAAGLAATLAALADGRVGELLVSMDLSSPGAVCPACGRLSEHGSECGACGSPTEPVGDVVEAAVVQALRQGCRVETIVERGALDELGGIGALLRF